MEILQYWKRVAASFVIFCKLSTFCLFGHENIVPMKPDFVSTNGEFVTIGDILVGTNSPLNTDYFKQFKWRQCQLNQILRSGASNAIDLFVEGAWQLAKDYPKEANGYQCIMEAIEDYEYGGATEKSRTLAKKLIASSAPRNYKLWAKGFLYRLDMRGKSIAIQFTAVDGHVVDLEKMQGKVVLVEFWATRCGGCIRELPRVKAAWDKFHGQGFEIVGINCDSSKAELEQFVKRHDIPWPQYFDGKQQGDNKFTVAFGIDGIPHMFLVDRKGVLRFDNVRTGDKARANGDSTTLEEKISLLLAEPNQT